MTALLVAALIGVLLVQFVLWLAMEVSVRRTDDAAFRWFAVPAIVPLLGLVVSLWYFVDGDALRRP